MLFEPLFLKSKFHTDREKVSLLERLFGRKEFQCIQVDYIDSTAVKDFGDLVSEPMTFRVASEPLGGGKVFESIQFQFEKVKSVSISEQNPLLPSLKSIDGLRVSDSRFKDQLSRDSISYTIQDGTWPRRDAEVVRQALERASKLKQ